MGVVDRDYVNKWERYAANPLLFIGFFRVVIAFALNIFLLYKVSDAIEVLGNIKYDRVMAALLLGSLLGISYPVIKARYKDNDEVGENGEKFSDREKRLLNVIKLTIGVIQLSALVSIITPVVIAEDFDIQEKGLELYWGVINVVVGVLCDFFVGSEFSVLIAKESKLKKSGFKGFDDKAKEREEKK
jgi:uncharacterized protein YqhQ